MCSVFVGFLISKNTMSLSVLEHKVFPVHILVIECFPWAVISETT